MRVVVETKNMSREDWLQHRKNGLGGSDAAAIAGVNPYKSPLVLHMEKSGQYTPPEPGEAALWGQLLEDIVAQEFIKRYNADLFHNAEILAMEYKPAKIQRRNAILAHDEHSFLLANIDRLLYCPIRGKGLLEVKTANQYLADEWKGEDIPDQYYVQVQHYLGVTGFAYAYVAVLIGGQKFKYYYIERDDVFIGNLFQTEINFWDNLQKGIRPAIDGSDSTTEMYKLLYPDSKEFPEPYELMSSAVMFIEEREMYKAAMEDAETNKKRCENSIKDMMQDRELANAGKYKISWKTNKKGVRPLLIKEIK